MPPKRQRRDEEQEEEKKAKKTCINLAYDFFHNKPPGAKQEAPVTLVCNGNQFFVFPQILEICSPRFSDRYETVEIRDRAYINLDALVIRGVQVFSNWAMDHENPILISINENDGDIMDDVVVCYLTAYRLRARLLCDLILHQACQVGKEHDLVIRYEHIVKAYTGTISTDDALRIFLAAIVAYKRRNGLANLIEGRDNRVDRQRQRFAAMPPQFQFDLMNELSKNTATQNPCYRPKRFLKVVDFFMQKKEQERMAAEQARLEERGSRESPLFVEDD